MTKIINGEQALVETRSSDIYWATPTLYGVQTTEALTPDKQILVEDLLKKIEEIVLVGI